VSEFRKYRLYVDEVGNPDMGSSEKNRFLSLTGVILELTYVKTTVHPAVECLKNRYFGSHPDDPVILHRKEIISKMPPFDGLRDPTTEHSYNRDLLAMLQDLDYVVITVVIDKVEHRKRYQTWRFDPYHYCLTVIVERFVLWLENMGAVGDVMAESRGGKEDRRLKDSFERVCHTGSDYIQPERFSDTLTSLQLKIKAKQNNVAGLQLADLLAYPSYRSVLARMNHEPLPRNFGGIIAGILEKSKYYRSSSGIIAGYGQKWLP
jgi:hypothetical protein